MAPGDPQLAVEGGLTRIALRSQFTPGTVTVTATAPGLASGSVSFPIVAVPDPRTAVNNCTAVPAAPTGFAATAASSSSISLTWTAVTPPSNCSIGFYNIYSSATSGFTPSTSNEIASGITSASYSVTGLADLTTYYFIVEAVDADGTSGASAQVTATTPVTPPCTTLPSAPTGLSATATSSSVIGLTWTAEPPPANCTISSYSVYRSATNGFTPGSGNLVVSGVTTASYSNTGLTSETTYYYVVEALDADGTSAASAQASATTPPTDIVSINAGGAAVSNSSGGDNSFVADAAPAAPEVTATGKTTCSRRSPTRRPSRRAPPHRWGRRRRPSTRRSTPTTPRSAAASSNTAARPRTAPACPAARYRRPATAPSPSRRRSGASCPPAPTISGSSPPTPAGRATAPTRP